MYEPTFKSTRFVRCPSYDRKLYAPLRLSGPSPTAPMGDDILVQTRTTYKFGMETTLASVDARPI